jgi:hypothetical protein
MLQPAMLLESGIHDTNKAYFHRILMGPRTRKLHVMVEAVEMVLKEKL